LCKDSPIKEDQNPQQKVTEITKGGRKILPPAASPDPSVQASKRPESAFAGVSQLWKRPFKRPIVRNRTGPERETVKREDDFQGRWEGKNYFLITLEIS